MLTPQFSTKMAQEAREAPARAAEQLRRNADLVRTAGQRLRDLSPPFAATLARGSSDQAAAFAKFLFETHVAMPTLSHAPSIGSLYHATSPRFAGVPLIAISQSGRSPDLLAAAEDARRQGAVVIAVVNDVASPLADLAEIVIPVHAGAETSVPAPLRREMGKRHERAHETLGRGPTLPIAGEAALKLKETSGLHAEAFSSAEVAHGPMRLVGAGDPVLVLAPLDVAREGLAERLADFAARGADLIVAGVREAVKPTATVLPFDTGVHPVLAAIAQIQSFYGLAEALALARGLDPDRPPHLNKVTRTL
jgi:glucosamine--fructose-6-phosphate aminotransferase (isomerizing)